MHTNFRLQLCMFSEKLDYDICQQELLNNESTWNFFIKYFQFSLMILPLGIR